MSGGEVNTDQQWESCAFDGWGDTIQVNKAAKRRPGMERAHGQVMLGSYTEHEMNCLSGRMKHAATWLSMFKT